MGQLAGTLVCSVVFASAVLAAGCGGRIIGDGGPAPGPSGPTTPDPGYPGCGDLVECDTPLPPSRPTPPSTPPRGQQPPSTGEVISCVPSLDDDFERGSWLTTWWTVPPPNGPTTDQMWVSPPLSFIDDGHGYVLQVQGPGAPGGYAHASSLSVHTTCFPKNARFGFSYRIDDGSLDSSRQDHAEIGSVTGLDSKGVRCGLLLHVMQGRLRATTGPNLDLGPIARTTWARIDMTIDGSSIAFERDGAPMGTLEAGCVLSDDLVRFSVSGGRSYKPGSYRAYFDDVHFGAL